MKVKLKPTVSMQAISTTPPKKKNIKSILGLPWTKSKKSKEIFEKRASDETKYG